MTFVSRVTRHMFPLLRTSSRPVFLRNSSDIVKTKTPNKPSLSSEADNEGLKWALGHRPTPVDKKILVLTRVYPSIDAVPKEISLLKWRKAKEFFRIRLALGMVVMTLIGCGAMIYLGKKDAQQGKHIHDEILGGHKKK